MHLFSKARITAWAAGTAAAIASAMLPAWAQTQSCQLQHPIVLSHHFSMRKICSELAPATGAASCVKAENYQKYCVAKGQDARGQPTCGAWRVTPEEEALPPRNVNATDGTLTRDVSQYHRYFSADIVSRLRDTCGNKVYVADKPAYASYEVRARSLRNTVKEALAAEGASKVILIGLSQGVQDARYMTALLPFDDADASQGQMKDRVAAVVSLSGEDGGAETASLGLRLMHVVNGGNWADRTSVPVWNPTDFNETAWKRTVDSQTVTVLSEQCRGAECNVSADDAFRSTVHAMFNLSTRYMRPSAIQVGVEAPAAWNKLQQFVGSLEGEWKTIIPPSLEANNGVQYISYGARIHVWNNAWGGPSSADFLMFSTMATQGLANDGYVSVGRQQFENRALNFRHVQTLGGSILGSGYHHMFFTGRNDTLYQPSAQRRHAAPYAGSSADFYQQLAKDLKVMGL